MLHVWYIYLQNWVTFRAHVGKYSSTMEHMGYGHLKYQISNTPGGWKKKTRPCRTQALRWDPGFLWREKNGHGRKKRHSYIYIYNIHIVYIYYIHILVYCIWQYIHIHTYTIMYCIMYKYIKYLYNIHFVIGYDKKNQYMYVYNIIW